MTRRNVLLLFVLLFAAACASGGGSALYRREVGTASLSDSYHIGLQIVNRYGYEIEEQDTVLEVRIQTHWKKRRPFNDEMELGITDAENRIIINGRNRGQTELGANYSINVTLENRVRVAGGVDWNETTNTPMFVRYADELTTEYRRLVTNIGVRRY